MRNVSSMTAWKYGSDTTLCRLMSVAFLNDLTSSSVFSMQCGFLSRNQIAPVRSVAVVSLPAEIIVAAFLWISSLVIPPCSLLSLCFKM